MLKYYLILVLIMGGVLLYVFFEDPCNQQLRADFSGKHPDYEILDSSSGEGSPASVQCHIYYKKPGGSQIFEDVWLYQSMDSGWSFSTILESREFEPTP